MRVTLHGSDGPLVVKLAGIAGGIRLYDEEIATAVGAGFRVAALDVSGDRRDDPPNRTLDWGLYADEVVAAIDRGGAATAVLWGTSFGCLIALATASRHPARVRGLLLSRPPDPLWRPRLHTALLNWAERRANPDLVARAMFSTAFLGLTSWEGLAPPLWLRLPALMRASLDAATPPATVRRKIELLLRDEPGLPPEGAGIPVEMISGAWDLVAPLAGARRLAARIPGAQIHVIAYSGHAGAYTRPRAYLTVAMAALKRLGVSLLRYALFAVRLFPTADVRRAWIGPRSELGRTLARQRKQRARVHTPRQRTAERPKAHDSIRSLSGARRRAFGIRDRCSP